MRNKDIVINLSEDLPPSYKHWIVVLETMPMKELIMEYVTAYLVLKISKKMENELQGDDATIVLRQDK